MRPPVDTAAVSFVATGPAKQAFDVDARDQTVHESRRTARNVYPSWTGTGAQEVATVKMTGEAKGLGRCSPVQANELVTIFPECPEIARRAAVP